MIEAKRPTINWMDVLWLALLAGLALLPPVQGDPQAAHPACLRGGPVGGGMAGSRVPRAARAYLVLLKIASGHAVDRSHAASSASTAATGPSIFCRWSRRRNILVRGPRWLWTALAAAAYCSYLYPALAGIRDHGWRVRLLAIRILFFFLAAMVVNRFVWRAGARRSAIRNWPRLLPKRTAAWNWRRPRHGVPSGWPLWVNFPPDSRTRFAIRSG
jgi:hypothetical protein